MTKPLTFNVTSIMLKIKRKLLDHTLGSKSRSFSETTLRKNIDKENDFELFQDILKDLTHFLVGGSKIMYMIKEFKNGDQSHDAYIRQNPSQSTRS